MKIVGCDLHARQQSIAMVDTETGVLTEQVLKHEGNAVREFYAALEGPVVVGIEASSSFRTSSIRPSISSESALRSGSNANIHSPTLFRFQSSGKTTGARRNSYNHHCSALQKLRCRSFDDLESEIGGFALEIVNLQFAMLSVVKSGSSIDELAGHEFKRVWYPKAFARHPRLHPFNSRRSELYEK